MFYVYHGYASPDNCTRDGDGVYGLETCEDEQAVLRLYKEHSQAIAGDEASRGVFKVIEGVERKVRPRETVVKWELA